MAKFKKADIKIAAPLFLLIAILLVTIFYEFNRNGNQDLRSLASEEDDAKYCVHAPDCCDDIIKQLKEKGDISDLPDEEQPYHACPGLYSGNNERGYCRPEICNQLPDGNKYRGRCGWYWIFHDPETKSPKGYGCMIGDSPGAMKPKYNSDGTVNTLKPTAPPVVPTQPPQPTSVPIPTSMPILPTEVPPTNPPLPTQVIEEPIKPRPQITYVPIIIPPYTPPTITPTTIPYKFNLPNILPPKEKVQSFLEGIRLNLLDFFSKILP